MSFLTPPRSRIVNPRRLDKGRRDFVAWLAAGTAAYAVGCAAESDASEIDVDAAADTTCTPTTQDARGPYWEPGAPVRTLQIAGDDEAGVRLLVEGRMLGPSCTKALAGYSLDVWQADAAGNYYAAGESDYRLRGKIETDAMGRYRFETILPGRYGDAAGIRPAHLHVSFLSPGGNVILTSQLYFEGDPYLGDADYCTRAGTCNAADPNRALKLQDALIGKASGKRARFDAVLPST